LAFEISEGQRHDSLFASQLITQCRPRCLLGDKAYDTQAIRTQLREMNAAAVIPSQADRAPQIPYDRHLYKERSAVECAINLLKRARRFATRYEKTLRNYAAMVALACALCWLRI
jgi:transposase